MSKYFCRNCSCEVKEQNEHVLQLDCIRALAAEITELRLELSDCECRLVDVEYDVKMTGDAIDEMEYRLNAQFKA